MSTKLMGIGQSLFSNQRGLSRSEAQQVHSLSASLRTQGLHSPSVRGDCYHAPRPHSGGCHPKPRHCHPTAPHPRDACHPQGSLKTDKQGTVTTPGGYKIEVSGPCEWKITGPDCKTTRVWGDPHVDEGDGGKWDFKRDSTFMLGDGTRINVTTKPSGANATVTHGLEIISGNDRVQFNNVDKGKSAPTPVTHDGFSRANAFGNKEVFVMGRQTDDWSLQGKEIIGSKNNGESFELGQALPAGTRPGRPHAGVLSAPKGIRLGEPTPGTSAHPVVQQMRQLFQELAGLFGRLSQSSGRMEQCHFGSGHLSAPGTAGTWLERRQQHLHQGFEDMGRMMEAFTRMNELSHNVQGLRGTFIA
jgi:hypothetical protein